MSSLEVDDSAIHGTGVFARVDTASGTRIGYFEGREVDHDTTHSYYIKTTGQRIEPTGVLRYLNHSCDPNAALRGRWLYATRDISAGTEVTIDYLETDQPISRQFDCRCRASTCRGCIVNPARDQSPREPTLDPGDGHSSEATQYHE